MPQTAGKNTLNARRRPKHPGHRFRVGLREMSGVGRAVEKDEQAGFMRS